MKKSVHKEWAIIQKESMSKETDYITNPILNLELVTGSLYKIHNYNSLRRDWGMEDAELVKLCQEGDTTAFDRLYHKYRDRMYNVAYKMMNNQEDALDLVQEIFLKAYQKIDKFTYKSAFSTWLYRLAVNVCIDELRRRKPTQEYSTENVLDRIVSNRDTPEDDIILNEQETIIWNAINSLKEKERTIIILRDMEGLSYEEISSVLKCSLGRVKSRIHEARNKLKSVLQTKAEFNVSLRR